MEGFDFNSGARFTCRGGGQGKLTIKRVWDARSSCSCGSRIPASQIFGGMHMHMAYGIQILSAIEGPSVKVLDLEHLSVWPLWFCDSACGSVSVSSVRMQATKPRSDYLTIANSSRLEA